MKKTIAYALAALSVTGFVSHAAAADAEAGMKVFNKCRACHSAEAGVNKVGPSLFGVVGRKAGTLPDYKYSAAMQAYGVTWDNATLDTYLAAPMQVVKGTKMTFAGLKSETERADVIAYLDTLK